MDGNGRWARQNNLPRLEGHRRGVESVREITRAAATLGIDYLTLYAFSVENWKRPETEVSGLMQLLEFAIQEQRAEFMAQNIRLKVIGRLTDLPARVRTLIEECIRETAGNTRLTLVMALSYGSRVEIADAVRLIAAKCRDGRLDPGAIDEECISAHLYTAGMPDPDLLIRTSGEMRLSNFLLWQLSYTEMHITPVLWPDFRAEHFHQAIQDYQGRHRRFGGV
jgi:undecaprenyl diphosphate synthase